MIVDGRALAKKLEQEVLIKRQKFGPLTLGVVASSTDAVTNSYIRIKKRIASDLDVAVIEYTSLDEISKSDFNKVDGIIVQLPSTIDPSGIPPEKDVDAITDGARVLAPVAAAMKYILEQNIISISGKRVAVVGRGRLVGRPAAAMFRALGAEVSIVERGDDVGAATHAADIIVLGAGSPGLLTPEMIKDGVIILDAGTSESSGAIVGDADPACAAKASLFTPVPGGIGPIAVVEIFANLLILKAQSASQ